jgi:hypothetical protein
MISNCETEITDFPIELSFENICWLKIPMDDVTFYQILIPLDDIVQNH